jgi:HEAT repeat protein
MALAVEPSVRKQARSSDSGERREAAKALAQEGSASAVKLLRTLIKDERAWVRDWSIAYCKHVKDPKGHAALLPLLKQRDIEARRNGIAALGYTASELAGHELRGVALKDKSPAVRREAVTWLFSLPGADENAAVLADACEDPDPDVRTAALESLVRMKHASGAALAVARLGDEDEGVRCAALWALSNLDREAASAHVGRYHESDAWRARLQVIETGLILRDAPSVDALIGLVDHAHRRVSTEAHQALRRISGMEYGKDPELWRTWFDGQRDGWSPPKKLHALNAPKKEGDTTVRYHGIEVASDGVCFAIDKSGSMTEWMTGKNKDWTRWGATLNRLRHTLGELPDGVRVNVLLFSDDVTQVFDRAMPLSEKVRKAIDTFLKRDSPGGNTNVEDALRAALAMDDIDTLFFLGDGEPNRGPYVLSSRIRPYFWTLNRRRKIVVHTISVGADESGESLLRTLAKENRGRIVTYK